MPGLCIAGISGAGKTNLHRAITRTITQAGREIVMAFPQAMTTTAFQHLARKPDQRAAATLRWAENLVSFAEQVHDQAVQGDLLSDQENYPFNWQPMLLLEGFVFDIPLHDVPIRREEALSIEKRLDSLGLILVLLVVPEEQILEQCVESTRQNRGEGWNKHLQSLGDTDADRARHFSNQQKKLVEWADQSPMQSIQICTGEQNWDAIALKIIERVDFRSERWRRQQLSLASAA